MGKKEVTRTRRAARHANIGFSVRTFGPSARETFIRRFISAIHGWMATDGERDRAPYEKAEHTPRTTFSAAKFHGNRPTRSTDRPTEGERRENSCERIADRLSREISEVETSRVVSPSFSVRCYRCVFLFLSVAARITFPQVANIF